MAVDFSTPAELDGHVAIEHVSRLWIVTSPQGGHAAFSVEDASGVVTNRTYELVTSHQSTIGRVDVPTRDNAAETPVTDLRGLHMDGSRGASIYIEGDIQLTYHGRTHLVAKPDGKGLDAIPGARDALDYVRLRILPDREPYLYADQGALADFAIEARNVSRIEWLGVQTTCRATCPDGGGATNTTTVVLDWTVTRHTLSFLELETTTTMRGAGQEAFILANGPAPSLSAQGTIVLPVATTTSCPSCLEANRETLTLTGNASLNEIHDLGRGRMAADLDAAGTVQVDEATAFSATAVVVGAGAFVGLVVILKFLAAALFSRQTGDVLKHKRRAILYGVVLSNPGATFSEVCRKADVPFGAARHHLNVLVRAGLIAERPHKGTLRFFENHGKYDKTWTDVVALRKPELDMIYRWLQDHPGASQSDVLTAMAQHGWSRSTTQHRLGRLVENGVVVATKMSRTTRYTTTKPAETWTMETPTSAPTATE